MANGEKKFGHEELVDLPYDDHSEASVTVEINDKKNLEYSPAVLSMSDLARRRHASTASTVGRLRILGLHPEAKYENTIQEI